MQSRTLILTSIGLTAALVLYSVLRPERRPADGEPGSARRATAAARRLRTAPEPPSEEGSSVRGRSEPARADPPTAEHAAELVELEIVHADTREPVSQATVWSWPDAPESGEDAGLQTWLRQGQLEEHTARAPQHRADRQGRVRVPGAERGFSVVAALGSLWGCASFAAESRGPRVVALAPDSDLRVQVVDAEGTPVLGAPVALRQRRGPAAFDLLTVRTEAPQGIAVLHHAGHFLRAAPVESFVVALQGLLDPPQERAVERDPLPEAVIRLVLEPHGSCEIVVVDDAGQGVQGPLVATLSFADTGVTAAPAGRGEMLCSRSGEGVLFEHVALGRTLAVHVVREGTVLPLEARGPGPREPGERVRLAVRAGGEVAVLGGRLLDSAGAPAGERNVRVRLELDTGRDAEGAWSRRTAADGRFAIDTALLAEVPRGSALAVYALSDQGVPLAVARRLLPSELRGGASFLGDFTLVELSVAAAGVVVDSGGSPVAEATITASLPLLAAQDGQAEPRGDPGLDPGRSDTQGRFELRGEYTASAISLVASKEGWVGDPVLVRSGERGVRLVLGSGGILAGQVLLDGSLPHTLVLVQGARDETVPELEPAERHGVLAADGHFTLGNLRPGTYGIRVVYTPTDSLLGSVGELLVHAGETTRDPRIDPLDLRAAFRVLELELLDELARPVSNARAFSRPSLDPDSKWAYCRAEGGRLRLLCDGRPLDVAISAPGFSSTELEGVDASRRVTLRPAARLYLTLANGLRVPDPPWYLGVQLTPLEVDGFHGFTDSAVTWFETDGALECRTGSSGRLRLELVLQLRNGQSRPMVYLEEDAPRVLAVAPDPHEQPFEIRFDPRRLEAAIESLREER